MTFDELKAAMKPAIDDMEKYFATGTSVWKFVYRWGIVTSGQDEGRMIAFFDDDTEEGLEGKIKLMDAKFHKYTDTLVDREYDKEGKCWYGTYVVLYPFDTTIMSGPYDGQNTKPLF